MLDDFSISVVLHTESVIQDTCDVIVPEEKEELNKWNKSKNLLKCDWHICLQTLYIWHKLATIVTNVLFILWGSRGRHWTEQTVTANDIVHLHIKDQGYSHKKSTIV